MENWKSEIRKRLADLNLAPLREAEIAEELAQHLEDRYQELLSTGETEFEASRAALDELNECELLFRELESIEETAPPEANFQATNRGTRIVAGIWQDVRYGARALSRAPRFAVLVVATLALGIGANTALFSVINGVVLNPLPYPEPDQLVTIHQSKPNFETGAMPYPNFRDLQKENRTFSAMSLSRGFDFNLLGAGDAERVRGRWITADFFSVLGVKPALGRTFETGEDEKGADPVALISAELWQRKFNSAPDVLYKGLTLDDKVYSIVGVIPSSFKLIRNVDVYVPIGQWNNPSLAGRRASLGLHGIGRLKPGVTIDQAQTDLNRVMGNLAATYPDTNKGQGAKLVGLEEALVGDLKPILWTLLGAVGFVLLIASVNVSNLLLARATGQSRDFAIRAALGASRLRLIRQSLTESLMLSSMGGAIGFWLAGVGTQAALQALPTTLPRAEEVGLDFRVLLFTLAVSLLTGIVAGLAPALRTSHQHLAEQLKESARGTSRKGLSAQSIFVTVQMALALVLLIGAGLMIRSVAAIWNVDPGFRSENVLTFGLSLQPQLRSASPNEIRAHLRGLSDRLAATPGVQAVSLSSGAVPILSEDDVFFWLEGQPKPPSQSEMSMALIYQVEPAYLNTMSIPLKRGRFFTDHDDERSPPVAVIDEVFAHKYFGDADPIGKRIYQDGVEEPATIVGVVGHVEQWSLDSGGKDELQVQLYTPFRQLGDNSLPVLIGALVRSNDLSGEAGATLVNSIRQAVKSLNSENVIFQPETMNQVIAGTLAEKRFAMILLDAFALVAFVLASIGLYGVISYLVSQRTQELGIRIALGAQTRTVMQLVLVQGMKMALAGVVLGLFAAWALMRLLETMLFGVSPTDPVTFIVVSLLLVTSALVACLIPARRATKVDPLAAIRAE